jgi:DNA polymerase III alpha subunit
MVMDERMRNRRMVRLGQIESSLRGSDVQGNWVTIGVIVEKSTPRDTAKGSKFVIFTLSDLQDTRVNLMLFESAFKQHWTEMVGSVVAILNPEILKPTDVG